MATNSLLPLFLTSCCFFLLIVVPQLICVLNWPRQVEGKKRKKKEKKKKSKPDDTDSLQYFHDISVLDIAFVCVSNDKLHSPSLKHHTTPSLLALLGMVALVWSKATRLVLPALLLLGCVLGSCKSEVILVSSCSMMQMGQREREEKKREVKRRERPPHTDTQTHRHTDTQTHRQPHTCVVHVIFFFWFQSLTSGELAFPSADANFGPALPSQGYTGMLAIGSPIHGCAPLVPSTTNQTQFVLLERGGDPSCEFDEKVQLSQECVSVLCV